MLTGAKMQLRKYQADAINSLYDYFARKSGAPLLVLPTGTGKSFVMAEFIRGALDAYPDTRILVLTHVKELIAQNHAELLGIWPDAPAGIYSAGLNKRQIGAQILFGGIQSLHKRAYEIQECDLVLIDEAHLVPRKSETMYRRFLDDLTTINPHLKVVGLTATPYRLGSGVLHQGDGALFSDIAFDYPIDDAIRDGYLSPLITKATKTTLDVKGVKTSGGDFVQNQLQAAVNLDSINREVVRQTIEQGQDRKGWLFFCSGVEHAQSIAQAVNDAGYSCATIFGDTPPQERARILADFKAQRIRALAAMNVLTTGFNAPHVDLIAMLRPTKSAGLYVQIVGRGTRLYPGKENCLVLDFARNIQRHGPVNMITPTPFRGQGQGGDAPVKTCPSCDSIIFAGLKSCPDCGHEFTFDQPPQLTRIASQDAIIASREPKWLNVTGVKFDQHRKPGKPPSMKVTYQCGLSRHSEWICFQHEGYARSKANAWWREMHGRHPAPETVMEALTRTVELTLPQRIKVRPSGKYFEVIDRSNHSLAAAE